MGEERESVDPEPAERPIDWTPPEEQAPAEPGQSEKAAEVEEVPQPEVQQEQE